MYMKLTSFIYNWTFWAMTPPIDGEEQKKWSSQICIYLGQIKVAQIKLRLLGKNKDDKQKIKLIVISLNNGQWNVFSGSFTKTTQGGPEG